MRKGDSGIEKGDSHGSESTGENQIRGQTNEATTDHGPTNSTDHNGDYPTSASRIQNATNVTITEMEEVFTCPVRPHEHR